MRFEVPVVKGQVSDVPGFKLKPEYFTTAQNARYADGQIGTMSGHSTLFTSPVAPYFIMPYTDGTIYYWFTFGTAKAYIYIGDYSGTHTGADNAAILTDSAASFVVDSIIGATITNVTDGSTATITDNDATTITGTLSGGTDNDWDTDDSYTIGSTVEITNAGGDYTGVATDRWNGCIINGIPVFNNGIDVPQMFTPIAIATDLQDLTGWNATWTAKVVRQFKNYLFAFNVTKSSTEYQHMVKWSDLADSGTVPASWDEADATKQAGETELSQSEGALVDAVQLRDEFIIYKEDSVWAARFVGGVFVFAFRQIQGLNGIIAQQCAVEFQGGHFVVGGTGSRDIYVHDGQTGRSVAEAKVRDYFYNDMDDDNFKSAFVVNVSAKNEIWICYPQSGSSLPNKALIWNHAYDEWTFRELPTATTQGAIGVVDITAYTWDTLPYTTWDSWPGRWNERTYNPSAKQLVTASTDLDTYKYEDGITFDGVNPEVILERVGMDMGDTSDVHMVTAIYPYAEGNCFDIHVGYQMAPNDPVSWDGPFTFDPASDYKIDCRVSGRLHSVKFTSEDNVSWAISGYGVEHQYSGKR